MKKLLKNKMLISLFLLVIGFTVTSSCYAGIATITSGGYVKSLFIDNYKKLGGTKDLSNMTFVQTYSTYNDHGYFFNKDIAYVMLDSSSYCEMTAYDINGNQISFTDYVKVDRYTGHNIVEWSYYEVESSDSISIFSRYYTVSELSAYDKDTGELLHEGSHTKDLTEKKIVYEITYDEDNKKAQISASIKNASEGDTLYYSTLGFKLNGKLLNPHEIAQNDISYIPVSENGLIHLQALDAER